MSDKLVRVQLVYGCPEGYSKKLRLPPEALGGRLFLFMFEFAKIAVRYPHGISLHYAEYKRGAWEPGPIIKERIRSIGGGECLKVS